MAKTNIQDFVGKEYVLKSGETVVVLAARNFHDIDVQFPDGAIRYSVSKQRLETGSVSHPNAVRINSQAAQEERLNQVAVMKCNMNAKIVAYRNASDIDVLFEDGTLKQHCTYSSFKKGEIANTFKEQREKIYAIDISDYQHQHIFETVSAAAQHMQCSTALIHQIIRGRRVYRGFLLSRNHCIPYEEYQDIVKAQQNTEVPTPRKEKFAIPKPGHSFADEFPNLAQEWHPSLNGDVTPHDVKSSELQKVFWSCNQGHTYTSSPYQRRTSGCPICAGHVVLEGYNDFASQCPELLNEWDYEKNAILPTQITYGSGKKVHWRCRKCGHEWTASPDNRRKGRGCPACHSMSTASRIVAYYITQVVPNAQISYHHPKAKPFELDIFIPQLCLDIEYDGAPFHQDKAKDMRKSSTLNKLGLKVMRLREAGCPELNNDDIIIPLNSEKYENYVFLNNGILQVFEHLLRMGLQFECPNVNIEQDMPIIQSYLRQVEREQSLAATRPDVMQDWDPQNFIDPWKVSPYSNVKVSWICHKCGYHFIAPVKRAAGNPKQCACCRNMVLAPGRNDFQTLYPKAAAFWDYAKNECGPDKVKISKKQYHFVCPKCGYQWQSSTIAEKRRTKCPACNNIKVHPGYNDLATLFPQLIVDWDYDKNIIPPTQVLAGSNKKVWWKCHKCSHTWEARIVTRPTNGYGCRCCSRQVQRDNTIAKYRDKYVGQSVIANNQRTMTLIKYVKHDDCVIQWDDGTLQSHVKCDKFLRGIVAYHPDIIVP